MTIRPILALFLLVPLAASCAKAQPPQADIRRAIHLEAEDAALTGNTVMTTRPGFSGTGYVGSFKDSDAKIVWTIPQAHAGLYEAKIHFSSPTGQKGYDLVINGAKFSGMLPGTGEVFQVQSAGKVELKDGPNTVEIDRGWGWYDIDAIDFVPAPAPKKVAKVSDTPSDPLATPAARALMHRLVSLYGQQTLSGQYEPKDTAYIQTVTGRTPAIYGGDLIDYSPTRYSHGTHPEGTTEAIIQKAKAGQIVTLSWHWNAPTDLLDTKDKPWWRGFYTDSSTFDVKKALDNPASPEYALLLSDMDTIAVQLQKLSDANVPVLWRPLHEAEGGWFWWGAKGPEPFKKLWRLMHDRFTRVHHLHNLIWVDCSGMNPDWYPGDDVVDVVGIDAYPSDVTDPLSSNWETLRARYDGKKLLALTEFGGVPAVGKMRRYGVQWSYFVSWTGDVGPHKMTEDALKQIYQSPVVGTKP